MEIKTTGPDRVGITTDKPLCTLTYSLGEGGKRCRCTSLTVPKADTVKVVFDDNGSIVDHLAIEEGLLVVRRTWNLQRPGSYRLQASFSLPETDCTTSLLIPAIWYRGNETGKGCFPSSSRSSIWSFLETRMPIACCAQLGDGKRCFTCATEPADDKRFVASVVGERHSIIISIPGSEWPYSYRGKKSLKDTKDEQLPALEVRQTPWTYTRTFLVSDIACHDATEGYRLFVERFSRWKDEENRPDLPWNLWFEYKLTRLLNMVKRSENGLAYIIMGEGNREVQEVYAYTSASFLVKSIEGAAILADCADYRPQTKALRQARKRISSLFGIPDDEELLSHIALLIGRFFLEAEREPGVFQDCYDLNRHIWGGYLGIGEHEEFRYMVNSRCNGEAMGAYLRLYRNLRNRGIREERFLKLPKRVARFHCDSQLSGGSFGRWWTTAGKPCDTQGTNGAYIGSFLASLVPYLGPHDPLKGDVLSALHRCYGFYGQMANDGDFYGDTLDADAYDKEAGTALLSLFLDLYDLEHDRRYLESAVKAANFTLLWIWQENAFLDPDSPLGKKGFGTKGMTSVSVAHHHLDFYGMAIAYDFLRLAEATGDTFFRKQATMVATSCRQLVATETDTLGRDASFIGWQPEQMNHTAWEYFDREERMNGSFDIDIAWVTVLTLESYRLMKRRYPSFVEE